MMLNLFGLPRVGKTALLTFMLNEYAYDRERYKLMRNEIELKNQGGFNLSIPQHPVLANYGCMFKKFGYSRRQSYFINPFRFGYVNKDVKTHFMPPYAVIGITESQKYYNSRMSLFYPDWQSRAIEQHGHNYIDMIFDTQRPTLNDINIHELSSFIEVISLENIVKHNKIVGHIWIVREIENSALLDKYVSSGKRDKSCFEEKTITANYNVFDIYDSRMCKPKFYDGHFNDDFDLQFYKGLDETKEGYKDYLETMNDELPKGFYQPRNVKKEGEK